jgi:hypothetical protein
VASQKTPFFKCNQVFTLKFPSVKIARLYVKLNNVFKIRREDEVGGTCGTNGGEGERV